MVYALPEPVRRELMLFLDEYRGRIPRIVRQHISKKYKIPLMKITPWANHHFKTHGWCGSFMLFKRTARFKKYHSEKPIPKAIEDQFLAVWKRIWNVVAFEQARKADPKVVISIDHFAFLANQAAKELKEQ